MRCGACLPVSSAKNWGSTLLQSNQTGGEYIASGTEKFRLPLRTGLNRRPDAMQRKRRNGHASTKISLEHEIAYLRDLDLKGLRAHWQSVFQRPAPTHLTRHFFFCVITYRLQPDRFRHLY